MSSSRMHPNNNNRPVAGIRVVAFDCDGVMFDSTRANTAFYNAILRQMGSSDLTGEQFEYVHMHTVDASLAYLFPDKEHLAKAHSVRRQLSYMPFIEHMEMEPDLKWVLKKLRPRFKTAVASNRTDTMNKVLEVFQLENDFDLVVSALDVDRPKPHPEMLLKVADHFEVKPRQILYVGDSKIDEEAADAAEIPLASYENPALNARLHIRSLRELESLVIP